MKTYLTCPVCDRPKIEGNICPNCETDLSLIRTLTELEELPSVPTKSTPIMPLVPMGVAILILLLGISLGAVGNSFYVQQRQPAVASISSALETRVSPQINPTVNPTQPLVASSKKPEESLFCGGFYYKVKRGDSLSLIARKLYGDVNLWPRIVAANSNLKGRVNSLEIGEILLVPNLEGNCP